MKEYRKPGMEFWDLEEEGVITTSLGNGGENKEDSSTGDFDGSDEGIDWGF